MKTVKPCPVCLQSLRVPLNRGPGNVTCPKCDTVFYFDPGHGALVPHQANGSRVVPPGGVLDVRGGRPVSRPGPSMPAQPLTVEQFEKFSGTIQPRRNPYQGIALAHIDVLCAVYVKPFTVTFGRERPDMPWHVKSLEPAAEYRAAIEQMGFQHHDHGGGAFDLDAADTTGFQCYHCRAGEVTGAITSLMRCGACNTLACAGTIQPIHGGGLKAYCPVCQRFYMVKGSSGGLGHKPAQYTLTTTREAPPAPARHQPPRHAPAPAVPRLVSGIKKFLGQRP